MRVLVCGGRNYDDWLSLFYHLDNLNREMGFTEIIHGGAKGADSLAGNWAFKRGVKETVVNADWKAHGKGAGPIRNRQMLDMKPDLVVAFPGGTGTAHMVRIAEANGHKVIIIPREP